MKRRSDPTPALTIQQPWAWAIVAGHKPVENRKWRTNYRGRLWIHAGKSLARHGEATAFIERLGLVVPADLPLGAIVGSVELVDVISLDEARRRPDAEPWASGPWCWVLRDPQPLATPIVCRGQMGLFRPDIAGAEISSRGRK